jgi:hypothetical protein
MNKMIRICTFEQEGVMPQNPSPGVFAISEEKRISNKMKIATSRSAVCVEERRAPKKKKGRRVETRVFSDRHLQETKNRFKITEQ